MKKADQFLESINEAKDKKMDRIASKLSKARKDVLLLQSELSKGMTPEQAAGPGKKIFALMKQGLDKLSKAELMIDKEF